MTDSTQTASKGKIIVVTSACGGSGRTMIAVTLATYLTKLGRVAFIGDDVEERGYFGSLENYQCQSIWANVDIESWTGQHASSYDRSNLFITEYRRDHFTSEVLKQLTGQFDYIVLSVRPEGSYFEKQKAHKALAEVANNAIVVYRHNQRSIDLNKMLCNLYTQKLATVLPVVNFRADQSEVDQGAHWRMISMATFAEPIEILTEPATGRMQDPNWYYYNTAFSHIPFLGYGAVNPALAFSESSLSGFSTLLTKHLVDYMQNAWK